ncbi:radical SAM protein [Fervidobacterium sp. 2310opik-2]|uniref:radical SAM protein n=1 Tax=Fervidobacterium sp. 2310opik-2 TaxID=1755815 RepID=UPI0013DF6CAE|nr:radical SAM protein [Fervidobacterium sp. 2310opik-2]KAF2962016.1 radical SAM protein [Fervidobacterium sp. 2310opik-2]
MVLRASFWTWKLLNGEKIPDEMPTAYLMLDGDCLYDCAYCTHAKSSKTDPSYLSRVTWKEINIENLLANTKLFKRICVQTVNYKAYAKDILSLVQKIREIDKEVPISVSTRVANKQELDTFMNSGIDQVGIAIDIVNANLHRLYRGWPIDYTLELISYGALKYEGRITTHIIVGLGENDMELYEIFKKMKSLNVQIALFAFTPVKGTKLEKSPQPTLERYRKIQILRYIMFDKNQEPEIKFDENGYISDIKYEQIPDIQNAFLTSGCTHCTRPYYNDKPTNKVLYNYHKG